MCFAHSAAFLEGITDAHDISTKS